MFIFVQNIVHYGKKEKYFITKIEKGTGRTW